MSRADFICPACKATVTAPASLAGEAAPCPKCGKDVERWPSPKPVSTGAAPSASSGPPAKPEWSYSTGGHNRGPVSETQLRALVEAGMLRPTDLVWREGMPEWIEARLLPGLFPHLPPAAPPPRPPAAPASAPVTGPSFVISCPVCHGGVTAMASPTGYTVTCPHCRNPILVPAGAAPAAAPKAPRRDLDDDDDEGGKSRRGRGRSRGRGFECPFCGSIAVPVSKSRVSTVGWIVFIILLCSLLGIILCWLGLLIREDYRECRDCGSRLGG
jgi:hypothetical protein